MHMFWILLSGLKFEPPQTNPPKNRPGQKKLPPKNGGGCVVWYLVFVSFLSFASRKIPMALQAVLLSAFATAGGLVSGASWYQRSGAGMRFTRKVRLKQEIHGSTKQLAKNHPPGSLGLRFGFSRSKHLFFNDLRVISCDGQRNQRSWNSKKPGRFVQGWMELVSYRHFPCKDLVHHPKSGTGSS